MSGEWLGVVFAVPMYVNDEDPPYRPEAILWLDVETGDIVGYQLAKPADVLAQASLHFHETTAKPLKGAPRIPARVRVASDVLAGALRAGIKNTEIVVAPTPELEPVLLAVMNEMVGNDADQRRLAEGDVTEADAAAFYEAAAKLWEVKPWAKVPLGEFVGVTCEAIGIESGALFVVGHDEPPAGFSLFRTQADVERYAASAEADEGGDPGGDIPEHLVLTYGAKAEAPTAIREEVESKGWRLAGNDAFPSVMIIDEDVIGRPLMRSELLAVIAMIEAFVQLAGDKRLSRAWAGGDEVSAEYTDGDVSVTLRAPLTGLQLGASSVNMRAEKFLERAAASIDNEEQLAWAAVMTDLCVGRHSVLLQELGTEELDELLFKVVPAEVPCAPAQAPDIVAGLRSVLTFASATSEAGRSKALLKWIPADAVKRLETLLGDPNAFGPDKLVMMAGAWAGYDMSTPEGVAEFLTRQQIIGEAAMHEAAAQRGKLKVTRKKPS